MKFLLLLAFFLFCFLGGGILAGAKSAIHEIVGCILILCATSAFGAAGIIDAIDKTRS